MGKDINCNCVCFKLFSFCRILFVLIEGFLNFVYSIQFNNKNIYKIMNIHYNKLYPVIQYPEIILIKCKRFI